MPAALEDPNEAYGPRYYREYWGGAGPYERNAHWLGFFDQVARGIVRDLNPTRVLDAGCAMGFLVESLVKHGVDAWGVDISEFAISQVDESVRDRCRVASLTEPLTERYDLITCIEVLEHIPAPETRKALDNLCAASDRILFSSTSNDFGEPTHVNVQPQEAWTAMFAANGFVKNLEIDLGYISPWAALYEKRDESAPELARRYDRALTRQRQENWELRTALAEATESRVPEEEIANLKRQLNEARTENLYLRERLVSDEIELGAARGRIAELEDQVTRMNNVRTKIQSRLPAPLLILVGRLRAWRG